jgi:hypothetical protein
VETEVYKREPTIDSEYINTFFDTFLSWPVYYLDFETFQQAVPDFDGQRPYMQIPFQYSLHIQESLNPKLPLKHREFLAEEGSDPRRSLAERLCADIPKDVCVVAYNMGFEKGRIKELAVLFDDLSEHLMNIHDHIVDLMQIFRSRAYYSRKLGGSYSIKKVLPALCPNDPELDYNALALVHNGSEAMNAFMDLRGKDPEERQRVRAALLAYCRLDTLAMVKILGRLKAHSFDYGDWLTIVTVVGINWSDPPPREMLTEELCLFAIDSAPESLGKMPEELRTFDVCYLAVYANDELIQYVPEHLREKVIARKDAITHKDWLDYLTFYLGEPYIKLTKKLLTPEFCHTMVELNAYTIDLVPKELITPELLTLAKDRDTEKDWFHRYLEKNDRRTVMSQAFLKK